MIDEGKLHEAAVSAKATERATGVPASLSLAQWALESGWGSHMPGNNCFGIKSYQGAFGVQMLDTIEYVKGVKTYVKAPFAAFESLTGCFVKHALLLSLGKPYQRAFGAFEQHKDPEMLARAIAPIYATDPGYADKLLTLMRHPHTIAALAAVPTAA